MQNITEDTVKDSNMLWEVKDGIWFDSEKLYIIKGKENYLKYYNTQKDYPDIVTGSKRDRKFPTIIFLSSTVCNLRCKYCFAQEGTYGNVSKKKFFELEDYIYVYKQTVKQYGGVYTICFFGGEPLLNFNVIEKFVKYLYSHCRDIPNLAVASNGTIMNNDIKEVLRKYRIHFCTSIDGPKEYNDLSRVGAGIDSVYDCVGKTLKAISDLEIEKGVQMTLNISHVQGYIKGAIKHWLQELEKLKVDTYEMVPVTSNDKKYNINLKQAEIYKKFIQLCDDYTEYSLDLLKNEKTPRTFSKLVPGILLHIMKRVYRSDCSAGFSFCVSPDRIAYPCHVCADERIYGEEFNEDFRGNIEYHAFFQKVKSIEKSQMEECNKCVAKNICFYICKGLSAQNDFKLPEARCVMMKRVLKKVIIFLAEEYEDNKDNIRKNLLYINSKYKNV